MNEILCVFIGGGIGASLRFALSALWRHLRLHPAFADTLFPWPTFAANILGCFLIGLFYAKAQSWQLRPETVLLLTTGLCGGFTTFSTLSYESLSLWRTGNYSLLAAYIILSLVLGILAAYLPSLLK